MKIFLKRIDAKLRKSSKRERIVKRIWNQFQKNLKPICDNKRENCIRHTAATLVLFPAGNYMFKVNNRNTRARCEICSKLTINIPERRQRLWTYFTRCSSVSIVNFEHVNTGLEDVLSDTFKCNCQQWRFKKFTKIYKKSTKTWKKVFLFPMFLHRQKLGE